MLSLSCVMQSGPGESTTTGVPVSWAMCQCEHFLQEFMATTIPSQKLSHTEFWIGFPCSSSVDWSW